VGTAVYTASRPSVVGQIPGSGNASGSVSLCLPRVQPHMAHVTRGKVSVSLAGLRYVLLPSEKRLPSMGESPEAVGPRMPGGNTGARLVYKE
jgi:hypothetical protein